MKNISIGLLFLINACNTAKQIQPLQTSPQNIAINGKLFTSLYQHYSAEYRALCLQAYNIARIKLDESLQHPTGKPRAIITDIDETIFDNSEYDLHVYLQGKGYEPATWYRWTDMAVADTIWGAPAFLKYAALQKVEIFYVTNREEREKNSTIINLRKYNFPNADKDHLLMQQTSSGKELRRQQIALTHNIVLLLGDYLADFSDLFYKKTTEERIANTSALSAEFGNKFIIIPNSVYGDWESAMYKYINNLTPAQKDSVIKIMAKTYK